jgi:hypothetical protein
MLRVSVLADCASVISWLRVALGCQPAPRVEGLGRDQRRKE